MTDFDPRQGDQIVLVSEAFGGLNQIRFAAVSGRRNIRAATVTERTLIYNNQTGELLFNANGSEPGFGTGGVFARLQGAPVISVDQITLA